MLERKGITFYIEEPTFATAQIQTHPARVRYRSLYFCNVFLPSLSSIRA